jgi:hypothetical protein
MSFCRMLGYYDEFESCVNFFCTRIDYEILIEEVTSLFPINSCVTGYSFKLSKMLKNSRKNYHNHVYLECMRYR